MAKPRWLESPTVVELDTEDQARRGDEARNDAEYRALLGEPEPWVRFELPDWPWERPMPEPSPDQETEA